MKPHIFNIHKKIFPPLKSPIVSLLPNNSKDGQRDKAGKPVVSRKALPSQYFIVRQICHYPIDSHNVVNKGPKVEGKRAPKQ